MDRGGVQRLMAVARSVVAAAVAMLEEQQAKLEEPEHGWAGRRIPCLVFQKSNSTRIITIYRVFGVNRQGEGEEKTSAHVKMRKWMTHLCRC